MLYCLLKQCVYVHYWDTVVPYSLRPFTLSPRHALLLTQAMCVRPLVGHCCALLILYSIANLSCRSVPTHYTADNMLCTVLFRYVN